MLSLDIRLPEINPSKLEKQRQRSKSQKTLKFGSSPAKTLLFCVCVLQGWGNISGSKPCPLFWAAIGDFKLLGVSQPLSPAWHVPPIGILPIFQLCSHTHIDVLLSTVLCSDLGVLDEVQVSSPHSNGSVATGE